MDSQKPHIIERNSNRWRQWKRGHGICATCGRDWVPKEGWLGKLLPHLNAETDKPCPGRKWRGQP